MLLALLSTLISSIALVGVAVSLFLQARQLRANQIQIAHASHLELLKLGLDNPAAVVELGMDLTDQEGFVNAVLLNWYMSHLSTGFDVGAVSKANLESLVKGLFTAENPRKWWTTARQSYNDNATSRRQKAFFAIVDGEFQRADQISESAKPGPAPPDGQGSSATPSP
jgi:hypothetical protein